MKGFKLDKDGDVIVENNRIVMTDGKDLVRQTVETVIGTNQGEWFLNEDEGINFDVILTKNPNYDAIRDEIVSGLIQVDETFTLDTINFELNDRHLTARFTAHNADGETVSGSYEY